MQWGWYAFLETLHHKTRLNVLTCYMTAGVPSANEKKKTPKEHLAARCSGWDEELGPHLQHTQKTGPEVDKVGEGNLCWPMLIIIWEVKTYIYLLNTWQRLPNLATYVVNSVAKVYSILF